MLTKTLKKVGNSQAIFLDKTLLGLVGAQEDTIFKITIEGSRIVLEPITQKDFNDEALKVVKSVMKTHTPTLKKLAK
jgi:antitoxin component of MazEF toxin-antitoxin module